MTENCIYAGTRLRAMKAIEAHALVHFDAPMTGGLPCRIPKGAVLIVFSVSMLCITCRLEDRAVERALVPTDLKEAYAGLSFVFFASDIGTRFELL